MSTAADTPTAPKDPEIETKKREAELAEAEARIQKALKEIAQSKKDAQTAANTDLIRSEQEKAKAQAEQAIAEAEKAKFTAGLPASKATALEGKVDLDDKAGYFTEILAHESARDGAKEIATNVANHLTIGQKVYLVKQPDYLKGALQLEEIEKRLGIFDATLDALLGRYTVQQGIVVVNEAAPLLALAAIPAVVGALADVAAMFRVDRSIKGRQTTVSDEALLVEVARALKEASQGKNIEISRPSLNANPTPPMLDALQETRAKANRVSLRLTDIRTSLAVNGVKVESTQTKIADLQKKLDKISNDLASERKDGKDEIKRLRGLFELVTPDKADERKRLSDAITSQEKLLSKLQQDESDQRALLLADLARLNDSLDGPKSQKAQGEVAIAQFEAVLKAFLEFTTKLVSVPDGGTISPMAMLAEISVVRSFTANDFALTVAVAGQGGEVETRKSLWTKGKVYHRAGTACTFTLFSNDGKIVASGLVVSDRQAKEGKRINKPK